MSSALETNLGTKINKEIIVNMANKKYHVTPNGPKPCKAKIEECKYKNDGHSSNIQEVQEIFENRMNATARLIDSMEVLDNPKTPSKKLDKLADHSDVRVRAGVARHNNTTSQTLEKLSKDQDSTVRAEVAFNKNADEATIEKLSEDKDLFVVSRAIRNPSASSEVLNNAALSDDRVLQLSASKNDNGRMSEVVLDKLVNTRDNNVLYNLVENPQVPEVYKVKSIISPMIAEQTINRADASPEAIERAWFVQLDDKTLPSFDKFMNHPNTPEFIRNDIENQNYLNG